MDRFTIALLLSIVLICVAGAADADHGKSVPLFDGKSLDGWTTLDGKPVTKGWTAEDGVLHLKGKGGDIYTAGEYANFILDFEWKVAPATNSGVKYRMAYYGKQYLGPEYQVLDDDDPKWVKDEPKLKTASVYTLVAPDEKKTLKPVGEWNQSRIVADGPRIEHWLNGQKVVDVETTSEQFKKAVAASKFSKWPNYGQSPSSRIQLQDHGGEVWFRNIRIEILPTK